MSDATRIRRSPDPEAPADTRGSSVAARIREMDDARAGAVLLLAATVAAIVWANVAAGTYHEFWATPLSIGVGDRHLELSLHELVNDVLMAVFFFTVGLEVRREFAIGELTHWSRALVPVVASVAGLIVPALVFVVVAAGSGEAHAWGVVISTDTAFLVGALVLAGPRSPGRLRVFLLALAVVDDIGALTVIAFVYTEEFTPLPLVAAAAGLVGVYCTRFLPWGRAPVYVLLSGVVWFAFLASGVHPTLAGVSIALLVPVYRPDRREVEEAFDLAHVFRQSPNTQYARAAVNGLRGTISVNERLQSAYAPYIAYVVLPLFALANAGVEVSGGVLAAALRSPVTWGVVLGLVVGKFVGVFGSVLTLRALRVGEFAPGLTLDRLAGGALLCGIGFTISLFIVDLAIADPAAQNEARVGVLVASVVAFALASVAFRVSDARHPCEEVGLMLARPVDPRRDHVSGPPDAPLTIVEYGDYQCGFCLRASGSIEEVRRELGDELRYVWRHAPLTEFHPNALDAAYASEAAALQGAFFPYGRSLFADQEHQEREDLLRRAGDLGLDPVRFEDDLESPDVRARVEDDLLDAEAMNITAVPTFFVNGRRLTGPYDARSLVRALTATRDPDTRKPR